MSASNMSDRQLRTNRQLTDRGRQLFEANVIDFGGKVRIEQRYIDIILQEISGQSILEGSLARTYINELQKHFVAFKHISIKFCDLMFAQRTDEAERELSSQKLVGQSTEERVLRTLELLGKINNVQKRHCSI